MKIVYHHRVRSKDGQGVHISELIKALREDGHDLLVVEPPGYRDASFGTDPTFLEAIKRILPGFLYELLEIGYNVPAFLRLRRAVAVSNPDFIYERYSLFLLAGILLSRAAGIPLLLEVNAPLAEERAQFGGLALRRTGLALQRWIWRRATHIFPVTDVLRSQILASGVPSERVTTIANGIDSDRFSASLDAEAAKEKLNLSGKIVLGFVGFMREWHRLDLIVELLTTDHLPNNVHVLFIGDGPARAQLEQQTRQQRIENRVTFTGVIDHHQVIDFIAAFDIALQPAAVEYASPLKLFEYMALGKAIVAPNQPNIRETLISGYNGLLFDKAEPQGMQNAIATLATNEALRRLLGVNARATVLERRMTWAANAQRVIHVASTILKAQSAPHQTFAA